MTSIYSFNFAWNKTFVASVLALPLLSACSEPGSSDVPVSIHAVNYSDQEFEYHLQDPANKSNSGGGESINRFAAGGITCCYTLPKAWHPGLKVKINFELYFPPKPGESSRTTTHTSLIEIPRYVEPQELWVVRDVKGGISVVLSNFQPSHPKWPGRIKGWPVPTLEYQRERADIIIGTARSNLEAVQNLSNGMLNRPEETAKKLWKFSEEYDKKSIVGYRGYQDKNYHQHLIEDLKRSVIDAEENLKNLEAERP